MTLDQAVRQIIPTLIKYGDSSIKRIALKCGERVRFLAYPKNSIYFDNFNIENYSDEFCLERDIELIPMHREKITLREMLSIDWVIEVEKRILVKNFDRFSL